MAHCPVCNMGVDDVDSHTMEEAKKGDKPHKEAVEKMGQDEHIGHNH